MIIIADSNGNAYPAAHLVVTNLAIVSVGAGKYRLGDYVTNVATVTRHATAVATPNVASVTKASATAYQTEGVATESEKEGTSVKCSPWVTNKIPRPYDKNYCIVTVTKWVTPT